MRRLGLFFALGLLLAGAGGVGVATPTAASTPSPSLATAATSATVAARRFLVPAVGALALVLGLGAKAQAVAPPMVHEQLALDSRASGVLRSGVTDPIVVTRDSLTFPGGCTTRGLATFVDGFFGALNRGEWERVDAYLAPSGSRAEDFKLFSWAQDVIYERDRVVPYLLALHARGERFRLLELKAATSVASPSGVASILLERPAGLGLGKVLIDCRSQRIWQMALSPSAHAGPPVLTCPRPPGWSPSGPIVACTSGRNARALAPDFRLGSASVILPKACRPAAVKRRVGAALAAFNLGLGEAFSQRFAPRGQFHPYTGSIADAGLVGRGRIARFVRTRYVARDGWTALALEPPTGVTGLPSSAVYGLVFRIAYQTGLVSPQASAKLVVDCRTGLLDRWVGPAIKTPPAEG